LAQGKDPNEVMNGLANALTNKLMHPPCAGLREAAAQGDIETLTLIQNLYRLRDGKPGP
jgi:glutamyl-tRNA reductase